MSKVERIKWLVRELNKHRDAYYNDSRPTISDAEYDKMFDELQSLEKDTGIIMSNSPTQTVGYEVKSELQKVKHSHPMLSLDKTKSEDDLIKFAGDKDWILSLKMDCLTVSLTYVEGKLIKAETRGNGEIGEDITHNARVFENIPMTIDCKGRFEIEGEAIITYNDFEKINNTLPEDKKYKNPRNLVSGSVRQLDSGIAAKRHIKFIAWKVPLMEGNNLSNSFLYRLNYARCLGFEVVPFLTYTNNDKETLSLIIESLKNGANVNSYPIDGLVLALNDIQYGESLGMTGHHPKHSIAFKFYDEEVETTLLNIEWSMGKSGNLTPVAIFEPVDIDGTTIERASLHNITIMNNLSGGFERIGDTLTIFKANQIIPQIRTWIHTGEYSKERHLDIPLHCPICNSPTKIKQDNDAKVLVCTNPSCKGKLLGRLSHFVSKKGMDIDGLSDETLKKFIELGWAKNIFDIYCLPEYFNDLSKMDGFGAKSVTKLQDAIEKSKTTDLQHFIAALSIPNIGTSQSKELCKIFKTWDDFSAAGSGNYDFSQLEGFGTVLNSNIHTWFDTMYKEDQIDQLARNITFTENENSISTDTLKGKTFVITGSLKHYKNREELKSVIERNGGKVSGSISKNTFALINNNINSTSSKNKKANSLGVQIISEEDFIQLISK